MPNFTAHKIKELKFPFKSGEVEFISLANGRVLDLIYTKSFDSEFFIALKKTANKYIIKGEKVTKPSKIAHLQKALEVFKENFCDEIIDEAMAFKSKSLVEKTTKIVDENEILSIMHSDRFSKFCVEIGFGSGRHLLYRAKENKDTLYIGIEIYKPAIEQVAKLAIKSGLDNVVLINTDARVLLSMMKSNSLSQIYLHFPVPWDDAPHRRVISDEFAKECKRTLRKNGLFELRSDSEMYFLYAKEKFMALKSGKLQEYVNKEIEITSKYEDRWRKMDKNIYDLVYENDKISPSLNFDYEMKFEPVIMEKIAKNFKNVTIKKENFFIHFEEIYIAKDELFLRISLGAFDLPQLCYIKISPTVCSYFIKFPLCTKENFAAHEVIKEIFDQWQK